MTHRVYMRDWYFNAGIVGFLRVISDDAMPDALHKVKGLKIEENYIEFDDTLLENYRQRFLRYAFIMLKNLNQYTQKYRNLLKQIEDDKQNKLTVKKIVSQLGVSYQRFTTDILAIQLEKIDTMPDLKKTLTQAVEQTSEMQSATLFDSLLATEKGREYIEWFLEGWQLKGLVSSASLDKYVQQLTSIDQDKKIKNNDICLSCQKYKAENEFSNSISNIIGFNKDNSNWAWGFKSNKFKLCPLCSLVYTSAMLAMLKIHRWVKEHSVDCYYFLNRNSNITTLYQAVQLFRGYIYKTDTAHLSFSDVVRKIVQEILKKQGAAVLENINVIEIIENPVLAGQSSKGYNVYSYTLSAELAQFLKAKIEQESIPKGYYKVRDGSYAIPDELIAKSLLYQLSYADLARYYDYYAREKPVAVYNLYSVSTYIFDYINAIIKGESTMEASKKIAGKAFSNGRDLRQKLEHKSRVNQVDGIVYALLNDLKIGNRDGFLDKYIRLMMTNQLESKFGSNDEMVDTDRFLQFGYSFINGLMNKNESGKNSTTSEKVKGV